LIPGVYESRVVPDCWIIEVHRGAALKKVDAVGVVEKGKISSID